MNMPKFRYMGKKANGETIKGIYEADDEVAVAAMLKSKGFYPILIREKEEVIDIVEILNSYINKVKIKDLSAYCRQFSAIINAGIPIMSTLEILQQQTSSPVLSKATKNVKDDLNRGLTLGEAFKNNSNIFPEIFVNMVEAGEISGTLNVVLDRLASYFEREKELINKFKSATTYPIILSLVTASVVIFLVTNVLPVYASLFEGYGAVLPLPTRILLTISSFLGNYWFFVLLVLFLLFLLFLRFKSTKNGRILLERLVLKIPVLGETFKKITLSRFARTLATMITSGIPLLDSIDIVNKVVGSEILKIELKKIRDRIEKGSGISEVIKSGVFFPPLVVEMVAVGEETGKLDEMLGRLADYYDDEVKHTFDSLANILEPVIIVIMAGIIGFIIVSIVLPMFEMLNLIG